MAQGTFSSTFFCILLFDHLGVNPPRLRDYYYWGKIRAFQTPETAAAKTGEKNGIFLFLFSDDVKCGAREERSFPAVSGGEAVCPHCTCQACTLSNLFTSTLHPFSFRCQSSDGPKLGRKRTHRRARKLTAPFFHAVYRNINVLPSLGLQLILYSWDILG